MSHAAAGAHAAISAPAEEANAHAPVLLSFTAPSAYGMRGGGRAAAPPASNPGLEDAVAGTRPNALLGLAFLHAVVLLRCANKHKTGQGRCFRSYCVGFR